jgi:3-oxoacyl-[acyl-carrier protein] reductase
MKSLKGQTAIITGAGSGLGKSIALKLAGEGVNLALIGRDITKLNETAEICSKQHITAVSYTCDITDPEQIKNAGTKITQDFNTVDILINNAGIAYNKKFIEHSEEEIKKSFDTNILGLVNFTHEILPGMIERKSGRIINIGSTLSLETWPNLTIYVATKYAVHGFTEGLRKEMEHEKTGVKVMGIYPGTMNTNIAYANNIPDPDWSWAMNPDDIADSVIFMLKQEDKVIINHLEARLVGDD